MNKIIAFLIICCITALPFTSCKKDQGFGFDATVSDYHVQTMPDISEYAPKELIEAMKDHLHFGCYPPRIDTFFHTTNIRLDKQIVANDTALYLRPQTFPYPLSFMFRGQHKCFIDEYRFEEPIAKIQDAQIFAASAAFDDIYVMGHDTLFTAFFNISIKLSVWTSNQQMNQFLRPLDGKEMKESIILSGTAINESDTLLVFTKKNHQVIKARKQDCFYNASNNSYVVGGQTILANDLLCLPDTLKTTRVKAIKDIRMGARIESEIDADYLDFFALHDILLYSYDGELTLTSEFFDGNAIGN